jgi:hemolysin III
MTAEDTQPQVHGREPQPGPGTTPDALRTQVVVAPSGAIGRLAAGRQPLAWKAGWSVRRLR